MTPTLFIARKAITYSASRNTGPNFKGRYVLCGHGSGCKYGALANVYTPNDDDSFAEPDVRTNACRALCGTPSELHWDAHLGPIVVVTYDCDV